MSCFFHFMAMSIYHKVFVLNILDEKFYEKVVQMAVNHLSSESLSCDLLNGSTKIRGCAEALARSLNPLSPSCFVAATRFCLIRGRRRICLVDSSHFYLDEGWMQLPPFHLHHLKLQDYSGEKYPQKH